MEKKDFYISNVELKNKTLELMAGSWNKYALASLLTAILMLIFAGACVVGFIFFEWYIGAIITFFAVWLIIILDYGYNSFCLNSTRDTNTGISKIFVGFKRNIFAILFTYIAKIITICLGLCLLLVPGVYAITGLSQLKFVMVDKKKIGIFDSIKSSFKIMKDNKIRIINLFLKFVPLFILGILSAGIALLWVYPYYLITKAEFYEDLNTEF